MSEWVSDPASEGVSSKIEEWHTNEFSRYNYSHDISVPNADLVWSECCDITSCMSEHQTQIIEQPNCLLQCYVTK